MVCFSAEELDSTVITGLVSELSGQQVKTFSVGFDDGNGTSPGRVAVCTVAADYFKTDHHEILMTGRQYADGLQDFVHFMEEPMADPSAVPLYYLSQLARKIRSRSCYREKAVTNCWRAMAFGAHCRDTDGQNGITLSHSLFANGASSS